MAPTPNGEVLAPSRVPDRYLGLQLDPPSDRQAGTVLVVAPAMIYVRAHLRDRLQRRLAQAYRRWLHPSSGRLHGDRFL